MRFAALWWADDRYPVDTADLVDGLALPARWLARTVRWWLR